MRSEWCGLFKDSWSGRGAVDSSRILGAVLVRWILQGFLVRSLCAREPPDANHRKHEYAHIVTVLRYLYEYCKERYHAPKQTAHDDDGEALRNDSDDDGRNKDMTSTSRRRWVFDLCALVHTCAYLCILVHICAYVCIRVHMCAYLFVCVHACAYLCIVVHVCAYLCIHVHRFAYLIIVVHICAYM